MKLQMMFKLTRIAKSKGGDRYEHGTKDYENHMVIYVPQSISRREGESKKELFITIE